MALLSRDDIRAADDSEFDEIECPEWGGAVRLSSISGRQRDRYEASLIEDRGGNRRANLENARAKLIVLCAVDEKGRKLFTPEDLNWLSAKSAKPLDRLFDACRKLTGLSQEDVDKLTEDFGATQDDASSIG
ncbi:hypothetical protein [Mangrovihabitans endophyticus]|uniref:Uncharacterized protein n=1 Tax=Mangrovihabitans endophyticus TaxID=1751298 RepID=A0A8J3FN28_9ACTN|nr:hypothetical protein [Mangrovihabitans endophyticus]GGK89131.1 hypothetical protein GCM10012284_23960 [Mangrovihabitans endophyticus]